ncbi:MAG: DnaJ family domain-containing protein [Thermodesulfobacteriota bacterium]|nr:DnaJ family domain-containing protein [Thermodesulfobacteriota bacterium]
MFLRVRIVFPGFEKIVEQRIERARREGAFDNLPGAGKPLALEDDRHVPEDLRLAYKILKNAGCLPPEIELRKEIRQTEDLLAGETDVKEQYRLTRRLNLLIARVNMMRGGHAALEIPQKYLGRFNERMRPGENVQTGKGAGGR